MTDKPLEVAHHPDAPKDERVDALRESQHNAMPSTVRDMLPFIEQMQRFQEDQMFEKSLRKENVIPFPARSRAAREKDPGMQSVFLDEQGVLRNNGYFERPGNFGFDMMRTMVDEVPILSSVILTRQRQIKRFCRIQENGQGPGFAIRAKDPSAKLGAREKQSMQMLESFFTNCGWESNPRQRMKMKRDNFSGFMAKLTRDTLTLDSAPIELEWKRNRQMGLDGLYAVDGATVRLCNEEGYSDDDEIFALQVVQGNVRTAYTVDDLIYVPRNPRTNVLVGGYGMSEVELLVKTVTGFLNAMTYNLRYFDQNSIPKGMMHLSGDYTQDDINAFKRYWNSMVKGINNSWTMPVMISKNQESKANFEKFGVDVDEIMFARWMTFLTSIICAIYGMAPDEINFESFTAGNSSLSGSDTEEKLINSKDKGLRPLLAHFEDLFSDYVVQEFSQDYVFRWTGLDEKDPKVEWDEQTTLLTVNEGRKARGWDEIKEEWGNAPLNANLMGAWMAEQQPADDAPTPEAQPGKDDLDDDAVPEDAEEELDNSGDEDNGAEVQKAFGLPDFTVDP